MKEQQCIRSIKVAIIFLLLYLFNGLSAQEKTGQSVQELADKLANPVANMISVPLQNNLLYGIGPHNGSKYTVNVQPVIPISLGENWNLITRYIIPVVDQRDITGDHTSQFGLGDATVSGFFSPKKAGKFIWGFGPAFLVPIATDKYLGTEKFGIGPTALGLIQDNGITVGAMGNQIWSVAGNSDREDVNQLYIQAFFSRSFPSGASIGFNMELTQNWEGKSTSLTFNGPSFSGITALGKQKIQMSIMPIIPLAGPKETRPDWGLRAVLSFLFVE